MNRLDIREVRAVLLDLDGTVYQGTRVMPGANETIRFFREAGIEVFFTTNNSTRTRRQVHERLVGVGIDCELGEVLTSGYLAALYARRNRLEDLYIFGSEDLIEEFDEMGVSVRQDEGARNLLIGYDPAVTYEGLSTAVRVALSADCVMACNKERVYPGEGGVLLPGCGAMVAPVEWCAHRECDVVIGKPSTLMADLISDERGIDLGCILVVGDTYESDILMARRACCQAVLLSDRPRRDVPTVANISRVPDIFRKGA